MTKLGLAIFAGVTLGAAGCAEPLHLVDRGKSAGASPYSFWPPPPSSTLWLPPDACSGVSELGAIAADVEARLVRAGYAETRWYRIGSNYQHGFALTTRLERLARDANADAERWSTFYPEPANLRWLSLAATPSLPEPGQYRAFLIAFTDLPMSGGHAAPIWSEQTLMDGPDAPVERSVAQAVRRHRVTSGYRFGVYEYLYDWDEAQQRGSLRPVSGAPSPAWPPPIGSVTPRADAHER